MNREVIFGNKEILDSYSVSLESSEPLQVTYDKDTDKELKLIFNFNLLDSNEKPAGISVEPIGAAASFKVDIIKGKQGRMAEMKPIAESGDSILYIYATFQASLKGAITFTYTLLSEKMTYDNLAPKSAARKRKA
jgi:hypothetical protein